MEISLCTDCRFVVEVFLEMRFTALSIPEILLMAFSNMTSAVYQRDLSEWDRC